MNIRYRVELNQTERAELTALVSGGKNAAHKLKRAQILLAADGGAATTISWPACVSAARPFIGPNSVLCSAIWRRHFAKSHALEQAVS